MHGQTCFAVSRELSYFFLVHVHIINLYSSFLLFTLKTILSSANQKSDASRLSKECYSYSEVRLQYSTLHTNTTLQLVACWLWSNWYGLGIPWVHYSDPVQTAAILTFLISTTWMYGGGRQGFYDWQSCNINWGKVVRPMKLLEGQTQQSSEDAALTQKVGKTRIPIEQAK